jgi:hypothetical protein
VEPLATAAVSVHLPAKAGLENTHVAGAGAAAAALPGAAGLPRWATSRSRTAAKATLERAGVVTLLTGCSFRKGGRRPS